MPKSNKSSYVFPNYFNNFVPNGSALKKYCKNEGRWRSSSSKSMRPQMNPHSSAKNIAPLSYDGQLTRDMLKYSLSNVGTCKNDPQMLSARTQLYYLWQKPHIHVEVIVQTSLKLTLCIFSTVWPHSPNANLAPLLSNKNAWNEKNTKLLRTCVYLDHNSRGAAASAEYKSDCWYAAVWPEVVLLLLRVRRSVYDAPLHSSLAKNNLQRQRRRWSRCCCTRQIAKRANIYVPRERCLFLLSGPFLMATIGHTHQALRGEIMFKMRLLANLICASFIIMLHIYDCIRFLHKYWASRGGRKISQFCSNCPKSAQCDLFIYNLGLFPTKFRKKSFHKYVEKIQIYIFFSLIIMFKRNYNL